MVLKNKILWGVLGVVVIVCFLQGKAFSLTHPLSGVLIDNASESSLISQTDQAYAALLLQNTQQKETFSSFNKTTNAEANQLIALSSKKNIHQKTFSDSDLPVINKFTTLNTVSSSAAATITSSASSGNWSNPTSWSGGVVPGASDDVVITAGTTILVDANTTCQSITIESGGILQIANSITLTLTGDWTNSGSFDAGTSGVVEFTGSTSSTISGTTTFEELIISKDNLSIPITITGNVTVSSGGNLTLTGGLIQVNSLASLKLDYSNQLTIPEAAGLEVNGGTLETGNFSITNEGLIRVNSGIANFGTASGNSVHTQVDGAFHVIDGTVNIAGRLENTAGGTLPPDIPSGINISGGTINLATEGNGLSNTGSLQVSTQGAFNFTGGTIVFQNASTASTAIDMGLSDGTGNGSKTITNGIFQFGNGSTTSLSEFVIDSEIPIPNIEVYDNMDLALASPLTISNELVLGTNTQISLNTNSLKMKIVPSFGSIDIPLSDDSGNAMPLSVEITSGSYASDASITVSSVEGKPGSNANTSDYLNRYWTLDINGITGLEYNVLADYPPSDVIGTESAITMGVYTGSLPWIKGSITTSTNEVSAIGLYAPSILFSGITAAPPTIVIDNNDPMAICEGSSVNLTTTATGDPTLTYDWTPTTGLSASNIANPTASPTTTTTYQVTVTDGNGFTASDAIDVVVNPLPTLSSLTQNEAVCANNPATIVLSGLIPNSTFDLVYSIDGVNQPTITGLSSDASGASSFNTTSLAATDNGKNLEISSLTITSTASGCSAPFSQSITLAINSPPAFTSCPTALIEAFTGAAVCQANVSYTVAATGTPAPSYTFTFSGATTASGNGTGSGETFNLGTTTVTVTATNSCGNESCSFDIEVKDNEAPTPITLASVTEQCKYSPANYPTTTDNCDGVITGVPNVSFPYATTGVSTITWSFTDNAGNTTTVDQIVTINDTQSPTWDSFPTDKNVECGTDTTPTTTGTPTVSDNCDNSPTLDFSDVVTNGNCAGRYTITRTWRAKDSSDNDVTRVQTINVDDTTQPILTCTDLTVANPDEIPLSDEFVGISAIDNCGIDTIMPISEVYHGLDQSAGFCPTGVTRTYRAYDNCGNTIECTQYIAVTSAGSCEKCQADVPFFSAILDGNPDSLWISPQTKREGICCGVTQDQGEGPPRCVSFNVYLDEDAVGLIFDINSGARPKGALFYQIDCGPETPVGEEICLAGGQFYLVTFCKPGANQNTYSIQSISGATDTEDIVTRADEGCVGNISVTGLDPNGDITWTVKSPNDQSLLNYLDLTDPLNPVFTADENSPATIIYEVCGEVAGTYKCEGNPIIDCAEVTVSVLSPISISFDVDLGDICEGDIPIINAGITPTNIDFDYYWYDGPDGTGNVLSTDPYWQPGGEGNYSLVVIDNETGVGCNRAISNFNITYDKIGPSIWSPPSGNLELNCNDPEAEQKIAAWIATATAQEDDGSSIPITTDYEIFDHACGGKRTVTFSAKDQCDNTSTATADIIIQDNDDPVITQQPSDGSTDCVYLNPEEDAGYQAWLNNHGGATASDQCDPTLTWTNNSATQSWVTDPLTNTKTKTVTFTVTDDCGNFVDTEEATYTLTDDSPPTLTCPEGPFVFQALLGDCELIVNDPSLTPSFSDECSDPVLTYSMLKPDGSTETGSGSVDGKTFLVGTTTVTYTVTDDVENKAECSFDVQVTDLNKPIFTYGCPDNPLPVNAEEGLCEALVNIPIPEVSDPCNEGYTLVNSFNGTNNATDSYPVGTTIVTWTVTDASNNVATCEQTVIVNDTQDPTISCPTST
ncbi:beta strand repeat-containing protein, partial [Sunxiuqinia elliptica]